MILREIASWRYSICAVRDDICEFKAWQVIRKRKRTMRMGLRILFFEDRRTMVCTTGFLKPSVTPEAELDEAVRLRDVYFDHKRAGSLHLLTGWGV